MKKIPIAKYNLEANTCKIKRLVLTISFGLKVTIKRFVFRLKW